MSVVEKSVDVDVPVSVAYDQWTQFEQFPEFMEGVEEVRQVDDVTLQWQVSIAGVDRSFEARIEEQDPDRRISWRSTEGQDHTGVVTFEPMDSGQTRVHLTMNYEPERWAEKVADFLNVVDRRVEGDLQRFKSFIEDRGSETGAWRGRVEDEDVERGDAAPGTAPGRLPGDNAPPPPPGSGPTDVPPPGGDLSPGGDPNLR